MVIKVTDKGLVKFGGFVLGIDNMNAEPSATRDQNGRLVSLHDAVNFDLDRNGDAHRRDGYVKLRDGIVSSLWCADGWPFGFGLFDGVLCALAEDGSTEPVVTGLAPWDDITYADLGDRVFWSNGSRSGVITLDLEQYPLGVAVPDPPTATSSASGGLTGGRYQVTTTWQRGSGEESGAGEPQVVSVPEGGGIALSAIPQPDDSTIDFLNVYVTPWNGDAFYRSASVPVGVLNYIVGINTEGKQLETLLLEPTPPATMYRMLNARLLYVKGGVLGWSEAVNPGITSIAKNRHTFSGPIDMMEPITQDAAAGVWVSAKNRTWFLEGQDPTATGNSWNMRIKHPYGVVPGSACIVPAKAFNAEGSGNVVYWLDTAGHFCTGSAGGVVTRLADRRFNAGSADRAASFFRERNGMRHVITMPRGAMVDRFSMKDSMSIRVFRGGQEID